MNSFKLFRYESVGPYLIVNVSQQVWKEDKTLTLVYRHIKIEYLMTHMFLNTPFDDNKKGPPPIAKFPGNEEGLEMAREFVRAMVKGAL